MTVLDSSKGCAMVICSWMEDLSWVKGLVLDEWFSIILTVCSWNNIWSQINGLVAAEHCEPAAAHSSELWSRVLASIFETH